MFDTVVVGAGLSGLCCARALHRGGQRVLVVDASDGVGGRARTDVVDGFLLDRGFQVLTDSYPEVARQLDVPALQLRPFLPGALVRRGSRFHRVADPLRQPSRLFATARSPVGTLGDKARILGLRRSVTKGTLAELFARTEQSSEAALRSRGFSSRMIDAFFRPFYAGVFLERELATSSRMLDFTFRAFSTGSACLPERGMGAIAAQLARALPDRAMRLGAKVVRAESGFVELEGGERIEAGNIVVATDQDAARSLAASRSRGWRGTTCLYFACDRAPVDEPTLVLDGDGEGLVNHLAVPSLVARGYAPAGQHLVSANVVGDPGAMSDSELVSAVTAQLGRWFGAAVAGWKLLRVVRVPHALPTFEPTTPGCEAIPVEAGEGRWVAGDHVATPSIQGAMLSGRLTAEAILSRASGGLRATA